MKCAVTHAHAEEIFLPRGREGTGEEENHAIHEKVKLFYPCRCCTGTNIPCPFVSLLAPRFCQWQAESSISSVSLGMALPLALENPFAAGTRTQEVQVSCCHGASQSPRGSQKSSLEFRRSPSCAISYESSRKGFHMIEKKG